MASNTNITFTDFVTPVPAAWLNNVNTATNTYINAKCAPYNAAGDGVTNDGPSLNAAIQFLVNNGGGTLHLPAGKYFLGNGSLGLTINQSAIPDGSLGHIRIVGDGMGNTELFYTGSGSAVSYQGAAPSDMNSYFTLEGVRLLGGAQNVGTGLSLADCSWFRLKDVLIQVFNLGWNGTDVLQGIVDNFIVGACGSGGVLSISNFSQPNAITFLNANFISNLNFGLNCADPATLVFVGGSFQGNGIGGSLPDKYGIGIFDSVGGSIAGAQSATFLGTYFENNSGHADIWFTGGNVTDGTSSILCEGCTFNRISNVNFVQNNVRADIGAGYTIKVNLHGNGFQGFGSYVASSGTPYVQLNLNGGASYDVSDLGNEWGNSIERPVWVGPVKTELAFASAYCTFNGALGSPTPLVAFNVASITKNGTGDYTITWQVPSPVVNYPVVCTLNQLGFVMITSTSTANCRIQTFNTSSVATDFNVTLMVMGTNQIT